MRSFDELMAFVRETQALAQIAGRLGWDQETMMPKGAGPQRAEEMAALEAVLHGRRMDQRVGDWLDSIDESHLNMVEQAHMREIRRSFERATKVPGKLASELARLTSEAQGKWAAARADDDFAAFAPVLEQVVVLKREEGEALAAGGNIYDAMLQDYEPGMTGAALDKIFGEMRPVLVDLRSAILDKPAPPALSGAFDPAVQMKVSAEIAEIFGYSFHNGRIDKAVHPFSSGSGLDVRITTRTSESDPFNCLYSTIHEVGHACYEQNVDADYLLTPLGQGASMGVHESQSRIYENQFGRSRAFTGFLYGKMRDAFGDFGVPDEETFYAVVNRVSNGFIRTEADEVQYNLHIMLRLDLERALMTGDLSISDLQAAWNDRFEADFGYPVDKASNGVLQDVHWSVGLFGYFPTYALGNVYAGCLFDALKRDIPDLDQQLGRGNLSEATGWLRRNLQQHGSLRLPAKTIEAACAGQAPTAEPLLGYLKTKFSDIYGL